MRAFNGLWKSGGGSITRLPDTNVLFLPQKPYLPLLAHTKNSLVSQLLFPSVIDEDIPKAHVKTLLQKLNLKHILQYQKTQPEFSFQNFFLFLCFAIGDTSRCTCHAHTHTHTQAYIEFAIYCFKKINIVLIGPMY